MMEARTRSKLAIPESISLGPVDGEPVRFDNVVSVELVSPWRLVIRLSNGRAVVVEPDFFEEIELCRSDGAAFLECIEENLRLRIYVDGGE